MGTAPQRRASPVPPDSTPASASTPDRKLRSEPNRSISTPSGDQRLLFAKTPAEPSTAYRLRPVEARSTQRSFSELVRPGELEACSKGSLRAEPASAPGLRRSRRPSPRPESRRRLFRQVARTTRSAHTQTMPIKPLIFRPLLMVDQPSRHSMPSWHLDAKRPHQELHQARGHAAFMHRLWIRRLRSAPAGFAGVDR